jgi:hypothetical protein
VKSPAWAGIGSGTGAVVVAVHRAQPSPGWVSNVAGTVVVPGGIVDEAPASDAVVPAEVVVSAAATTEILCPSVPDVDANAMAATPTRTAAHALNAAVRRTIVASCP